MLLQSALLPFDPAPVAEMCSEIDRWRDQLDTQGPFLRIWQGRLRRDLEAQAVAASTSMEGVPVTVDEVRRILAGERPAEVKESDARLVEGYRDAMGFVLRRADDGGFRWDRELVIGLHDRVLAGDYGAGAGRFRTATRRVANNQTGEVVFDPPDWQNVPGLVDEMCELMSDEVHHPAIAAAWVHIATAAIHPFGDGNGRGARVLASLAMFRGGFRRPEFTSLEEWWGHHLNDYYGAFQCLGRVFRHDADVTPFIVAHVSAQLSQVRALDMRERVQQRIFIAILDLLETAGLHQRLSNAVWDAFFGSAVNPSYYRAVADISPPTASTDLAKAVAAGLLRAEGQTRGRQYFAGPRLFREVARLLNITDAGDDAHARTIIVSRLTERIAAADIKRGIAIPTIGALIPGVVSLSVSGADDGGVLVLTTANRPPLAGSAVATLHFAKPFSIRPTVIVDAVSPAGARFIAEASTTDSAVFRAFGDLTPNTTYKLTYHVVQG